MNNNLCFYFLINWNLRACIILGYIVSSGGQTGGSIGGISVGVWKDGLSAIYQTQTHSWSTTSVICCADVWYHIAVTWDSATLRMYINGTSVSTGSATIRGPYSDNHLDDFTIGKPNNVDNYFAQMTIDDMKFWDQHMDSSEVLHLFNSYRGIY